MFDKLMQVLGTTRGRLVAGVLAVALVGGGIAVAVARGDALPDDAAFRYGDRVVTTTQLKERLEVLEALYGVKTPEDKGKVDEFNRDAAKSYVVSLVLADAAAERDIVISDKEAQTELDKLIDQQLTGGRAAFVEFLSTSGISERDVLDEIRAQLATGQMINDVTAEVPVAGEKDALATYSEHKAEMVTPAGRELVNIVVASKADADRVAGIARRTGRLGPLAATWSLDGATRDKGGKLGLVTEAQLEPDYARAAFAARKAQVFGPVQTKEGWNVGQVIDVVSAKPLAFKDIKGEIVERLTAQDRLEVWQKFLAKALKSAEVEYADRYLPDKPTAPSTDITPSEPAPEPGAK